MPGIWRGLPSWCADLMMIYRPQTLLSLTSKCIVTNPATFAAPSIIKSGDTWHEKKLRIYSIPLCLTKHPMSSGMVTSPVRIFFPPTSFRIFKRFYRFLQNFLTCSLKLPAQIPRSIETSPVFVGLCHHGMARPQVADGGTASDMEGSCD